jgi:hypothetical protein
VSLRTIGVRNVGSSLSSSSSSCSGGFSVRFVATVTAMVKVECCSGGSDRKAEMSALRLPGVSKSSLDGRDAAPGPMYERMVVHEAH